MDKDLKKINDTLLKTDWTKTLKQFDPKVHFNEIKNFSAIILAKRRTGKSVLMKDLLFHIKDNYKEAHLFSYTKDYQPETYSYIPEGNKYNGFDNEKLAELVDKQDKYILQEMQKLPDGRKEELKKKLNHLLLIFDDCIASEDIRTSKVFRDLFILGRHKNIAVIVLSQDFAGKHGITSVCRANCDFVFTFYPSKESNTERVCDEYLSISNKKVGESLLRSITLEPFHVLCVCQYITGRVYEDMCFQYLANPKIPKYTIGEDTHHNLIKINNQFSKSEKGSSKVKRTISRIPMMREDESKPMMMSLSEFEQDRLS